MMHIQLDQRSQDFRDGVAYAAHNVHAIQHVILAQAAARAYPDRYRLLGGPPLWSSDTPSPCVHCAAWPGEPHRTLCPAAAPSTSEAQPS